MTQHAIEIETGRVTGLRREQGITEYRGIPFAAPPVGAWRWRGPQPALPWSGVRAAERVAMPAWQERNPMMGVDEIGDDCLAVNIWVPEGDGPFPVMVWFHGGGYTSGSPSQLLYHGARLAAAQQVIVVNAAYRLGVWGYGWFPELEADGNLGLRDQIAALAWVQRNIAGFGGDPRQVTVFGESAGGFSVATLLATPAADDLFQRAIVQSGSADMVLAPAEAEGVSCRVAQALPAGMTLMDASARDIVKAQRAAYSSPVLRGLRQSTPSQSMVFMPVVDGDLLPRRPLDAIAAGCARDRAIMAGICRDEYHLFQYAPPFNGGKQMAALREVDDAAIFRRFMRALPEHGEAAFVHYQEQVTPDPRRCNLDWFSAMEGDNLFRVPTQRLLDAQHSAGGQAWAFQFTWEAEMLGVPLGACHVVDVPFVFGITDTPVGQLFTGGGEQAAALSRRVQQAWGDFSRGESPGWAPWPAGAELLGREQGMAPILDEARAALWEPIIPAGDPAAGAGGAHT